MVDGIFYMIMNLSPYMIFVVPSILLFVRWFLSSPLTGKLNNSFGRGIVTVFLTHIVYVISVLLVSFFFEHALSGASLWALFTRVFCFLFIWIIQLLYVIPLAIFFKNKGQTEAFKGVIVATGITFLLSGGFFIILWKLVKV